MILDENGLQIDTFDDVVESVYAGFATALSLTPEQVDTMRTSVKSTLGQLARNIAERELALQEVVLDVYDTLSWNTEGANLDRIVRLLGVVRTEALTSRVTGTATGTALHVIPDGTQLSYAPTGSLWVVVGDTAIDGSGSADVTLEALTPGTATPVNTGFDFSGDMNASGSAAADVHTLTFTGFGLGAPVDIDVVIGTPLDVIQILAAFSAAMETESAIGGDIEGVVSVVRITNATPLSGHIEIWTNPALATGTIVYSYTGSVVPNPTLPITASAIWTVLDDADFDTFVAMEQPIVGGPEESDAALRSSAATEAFRRGQGPQAAIRAAVSLVTGVTYVGVWESQVMDACDVDADGIPGRAINVVVDGGSDADVAQAIYISRGAGTQTYAQPGLTAESVIVYPADGPGSPITIQFNRVEQIEMWIECEITTSTAEPPPAPPDVEDIVAAILLEAGAAFSVGDDVLPWRLEGAVFAASLPGIDDVRVELSYDDGGTDPYSRAKRDITLRQRAVFDAARITVVQV